MKGNNAVRGTEAAPRGQIQNRQHSAGNFVDRSYENGAGKRNYRLYIPSGYTGQSVPLVVMLHGCVQTAEDLARGSRMNDYAEAHTLLVAYPKQTLGPNRLNCWSWFNPEDQQRDQGEPSIIAGITKQIMSEYAVDPGRVYVAGISAGGAMAVVLGAAYPDLYAAIGVHSGVEYAAANNLLSAMKASRLGGPDPGRKLQWPRALPAQPRRFVPLILFHGDRDRVANRINADQVVMQWALAQGVALSRTGTAHAGGLPTRVIRDRVPGGRAYTRTTYHDPAGRDIMEKWIIHEAGHAWAGGDGQVMFMDPLGPNASFEMVRFFLEHPME
jgi:poly(hydroxyalkanoate) depolymerase family esterase